MNPLAWNGFFVSAQATCHQILESSAGQFQSQFATCGESLIPRRRQQFSFAACCLWQFGSDGLEAMLQRVEIQAEPVEIERRDNLFVGLVVS